MKPQNKVILSLGTNQGNRFLNIQNCIQMIHFQAGTVITISKIYETPSWGFASDAFYNCALLMHTSLSANTLLKKVLSIEKKLGRIRNSSSTYQSRIIDIDIIAFNEEIIENKTLQVPHPLMHQRNFVLLPMNDILPKWNHPILNKEISELLSDSNDASVCKFVRNVDSEISKISFENIKYIAFEGNIGVGKSSLVQKLAEDLNANMVFERFVDNPFLAKFYEDKNRYALSLELSFFADRYKQLTEDFATLDETKSITIADYQIYKSLIFAKITLNEAEYSLYKSLFETLNSNISKPDLCIYLKQNTNCLLDNIKKRNRKYESSITSDYLEKIENSYLEYLHSKTEMNILIIDVSDRDFLKNQSDYVYVLEKFFSKIQSLY